MTSHSWKRFFIEAGLPSDIADNYAIIFTENRIRFDMLDELNKEILYDMGIKKMGDVISIMRHAKEVHSNSYRERVFKNDAHDDKESIKTTFQPDSTISSSNNQQKRIIRLPMESSRIVKVSKDDNISNNNNNNNNNSNSNKNNVKTNQSRQVISKANTPLCKNTPMIVRNVTGLNSTTAPIRKRIEPPSQDDYNNSMTSLSLKIMKTSNVTGRNKFETQGRLVNFSNQIEKVLSSNSNSNQNIIRPQKRVPIEFRLNNKSDVIFAKKNQINKKPQSSIKDRLGKKSVFERIDTPRALKVSIFDRLGTK